MAEASIRYGNFEPVHPGFAPISGNTKTAAFSENIPEIGEAKAYLDRDEALKMERLGELHNADKVTAELGTARPDLSEPQVKFGAGSIRNWGEPDNPHVYQDPEIIPVPESMYLAGGNRNRAMWLPF